MVYIIPLISEDSNIYQIYSLNSKFLPVGSVVCMDGYIRYTDKSVRSWLWSHAFFRLENV